MADRGAVRGWWEDGPGGSRACRLWGNRLGSWVGHSSDEGWWVNTGSGRTWTGFILEPSNLCEDTGQRLELRAPAQQVVPVIAATELFLTSHDGRQRSSYTCLPICLEAIVPSGCRAQATAPRKAVAVAGGPSSRYRVAPAPGSSSPAFLPLYQVSGAGGSQDVSLSPSASCWMPESGPRAAREEATLATRGNSLIMRISSSSAASAEPRPLECEGSKEPPRG